MKKRALATHEKAKSFIEEIDSQPLDELFVFTTVRDPSPEKKMDDDDMGTIEEESKADDSA